MIFNYNLLFISSVVSLFVLIVFVLYLKIRDRFPKQMICWFCHKSQKVSTNQINSFNCLHCQQYNGFSEDGNYNKVIRDQFERRSDVQYCQPISDSYSKSVQLCSQCNVRQEIKIKLLSEFIPFNETNFSQECEEYKKYLEKEYKLCPNCEITVRKLLSEPINCIKDVIRNTIVSNIRPKIDSVFVGHNNRPNAKWIPILVINVFEFFSLFCAIIVLIFSLNEFQNETELSFFEFPKYLIQYLTSFDVNQKVVIFCGFVSSMTSILISGKQSLKTTNIFSQLLWIAMILSENPLMMSYIDKIDCILLSTVLSSFVVFFSTINCLFALFNTKSKIKQNLNQTKEEKKCFENSTKSNVCSDVKTSVETDIKDNKSVDQSIGQQIQSLSILDETESTLNWKRNQLNFNNENNIFSNNRYNSVISETSSVKSVVLPAKFHYQSIAQTSWVSSFKPNASPRKERHNYSLYFSSSQSLANFSRTSQWVNHISGLVTPPPSAPTSVCSDSGLVNGFSSLDANNCLFPKFERHRNHFSNSSHYLTRGLISQQFKSHSIKGTNPENTVIEKTIVNESPNTEEEEKSTPNVTQSLILGLFVLILFCFVIFLSLPVIITPSCGSHSMGCSFTLQSVSQNNEF